MHCLSILVGLLLFSAARAFDYFGEDEDRNVVVVHVKQGSLRGAVHYAINSSKPIQAFYSIPYAQPPMRELRFAPPKPVEENMWNGYRDATFPRHICHQAKAHLDTIESLVPDGMPVLQPRNMFNENCLEMDIYTPDTNASLPVIFWIHGGDFLTGTGHTYNGTALCTHNDVVVVTFNYRLGVLGFLAAADEHIPGNWGLLDQAMALQWVKENIAEFGGDPDRVTIMGQGAGAWSVSGHMVSPLSEGLFRHAVTQSGSLLLDGLIDTNPYQTLKAVAWKAGCKAFESADMIDCLRTGASLGELITASTDIKVNRPVIDGVFFPKPLEQLYAEKDFSGMSYICGWTADDLAHITMALPQVPDYTYDSMLDEIHRVLQMYNSNLEPQHIKKLAKHYFKHNFSPKVESLMKVKSVEILTDFGVTFPIIHNAQLVYARGGNPYVYSFVHPPSWLEDKRSVNVVATHFDEVYFLFGVGFLDSWVNSERNFTDEEQQLSLSMMKYWTNVATNGSPNDVTGSEDQDLFTWSEYDKSGQTFLLLKPSPSFSQKFKEKKFDFYRKTMTSLQEELKQKQKSKEEL